MSYSAHATALQLASASRGFDNLFSNEMNSAKNAFASDNSPFHLIGLGVCSFLEAALGMEAAQMTEASRLLALAETGSKNAVKAAAKQTKSKSSAFPPGIEYEIVNADAVVLLGITHALSESYYGYLQCIYSMNSAHSKFGKLYKTVFPNGLEGFSTPSLTHPLLDSFPHPLSIGNSYFNTEGFIVRSFLPVIQEDFVILWIRGQVGLFSFLLLLRPLHCHLHRPTPGSPISVVEEADSEEIQNIKNLIVAGTGFGFGLFTLVFSLLPKRAQSVAGLFGYAHSRTAALQALAVSADYAAKGEVHGVFAGLVLMTYHGVILLLTGYQADEPRIIREYEGIVTGIEARYPKGALWILNRAKILRMTYDPEGAIRVLKAGLESSKQGEGFKQADTLLVFELAWTYLSQRQYVDCADAFLKLTDLNSWSHGTYYFIAAGCHISLSLSTELSPEEKEKHLNKAQELLDALPNLLDKRKMGGKDLPTEVFIKKKLTFYKEKQKRRGGDEKNFVQCIKISPAEELGICAHSNLVCSFPSRGHRAALTCPKHASISSSAKLDLDTPDELALRLLLLGIVHRSIGCVGIRRKRRMTTTEPVSSSSSSSTSGTPSTSDENPEPGTESESTSSFIYEDTIRYIENSSAALRASRQLAHCCACSPTFYQTVLDLKEVEVEEKMNKSSQLSADLKERWHAALKSARVKLDGAMALATSSVDLSSRLDSRVAMLRDEIGMKAEIIGVTL
ncbi:hypothetical protein BT96DRAFT_917160 [Gymnopus androsaceus JB14]|uniref:Mitochondrial outer membrane protein IML2 n=1 Tax=Gymnopus androsaceus JB14 TaxID=1447944 RepID=A0A6A4I1Y7_9AGAR|nr:hypothetical protein BT96DRAFT_917160 [Gymnopus androsaceus JB14]